MNALIEDFFVLVEENSYQLLAKNKLQQSTSCKLQYYLLNKNQVTWDDDNDDDKTLKRLKMMTGEDIEMAVMTVSPVSGTVSVACLWCVFKLCYDSVFNALSTPVSCVQLNFRFWTIGELSKWMVGRVQE